MSIAERLKAAWKMTCFTVSDMALWFNVSRAAMNSWLSGKHEPFKGTAKQLEPLLLLLEKILNAKDTKNKFPVPLEVRQYERKAYILKVREHASSKFFAAGVASRGEKMCGTNNQD